jgi:hypothetical protein
MKKNLNEELRDVYYLLGYDRNKILSEQAPIVEDEGMMSDEDWKNWGKPIPDEDMDTGEELYPSFDMDIDKYEPKGDISMGSEYDEFNEADMPSIAPSKPGIKTPTKPNKPGTPYKPKVKPAPKAKKSDLPDWLTFDELGIEF